MFGKNYAGYKQNTTSDVQFTGYNWDFISYQKSFAIHNRAHIHNLLESGGTISL